MSHVRNSKYLLSLRSSILSRSVIGNEQLRGVVVAERMLSTNTNNNTSKDATNWLEGRQPSKDVQLLWKQNWERRFCPLSRRKRSSTTPSSSGYRNRHDLWRRHAVDRSLSSMCASKPEDVDAIKCYIDDLMEKKTSPLSLSLMYKYSCPQSFSRLANAQFLYREIPIRIAHRLSELQSLPYGLAETQPIKKIIDTYIVYLSRFYACKKPKTARQERQFTEMLRDIVLDRHSIPNALYFGLADLKDQRREGLSEMEMETLEQDISRFMMARVGLRFLTEHHVLSSPDLELSRAFRQQQAYLRDDADGDDSYVCFNGAISNRCNPVVEATRVANQVRKDCLSAMGMAPEIQIIDCCDKDAANFTYVPMHFHYMIAELLINSCRATVRHHQKSLLHPDQNKEHQSHSSNNTSSSSAAMGGSLNHSMKKKKMLNGSSKSSSSIEQPQQLEGILPPIQVIITIGAEDCSIKIADRGGGVPRSACNNLWTFAHSTMESIYKPNNPHNNTMDHPEEDEDDHSKQFDKNVFTNTLGRSFGLPMAKIYAQYFGGDLTIKSMEGFGVDAYLHIPVLGVQCENLPESVINSPGNMDSTMDLARRMDENVPNDSPSSSSSSSREITSTI